MMLLPAAPGVIAVTSTIPAEEVAVTSVVGLLLIAVARLAAAVVVLAESAKLLPVFDAAVIELGGDSV